MNDVEGSAGELNGGEGGSAGNPSDGGKSWDVDLWIDGMPEQRAPDQHFSMRLTPNGKRLDAVFSCDVGLPLRYGTIDSGVRTEVLEPLATDGGATPVVFTIPCNKPISLTQFAWHGVDTDSDGEFDLIEGSGTGSQLLHFDEGNSLYDTVQLQLRARRDLTPPHLNVPNAAHPLDTIQLSASEAIAPRSRVRLDRLGTQLNLPARAGGSLGIYTQFLSGVILPFGSEWNVTATGHDWAGLPLKGPFSTLSVVPDPGILPQDGFESIATNPNPPIRLSGAKFVNAVGTIPALNGQWSLFLNQGDEATLHLVRQGCQRRLRFSARALFVSSPSYASREFTAGVIGGSARHAASLGSASKAATGDPTWPVAEPVTEHTLDLTDAGADVVVRIAVGPQSTCWPSSYCYGRIALLIDDVRIE
ncbi:MAG: hypothetical protein ACOY0T_20385 [Myxococcota bacterium]